MSTPAPSTSPHAAFDARAVRDAHRIAGDTTIANPRALVGAHLDLADLDHDAAPWHLLWASIYAHAANLRDHASKINDQPVQGPQSGVPCGFCGRIGCWASHRVFWAAEDGGDLEVGERCVVAALRWVRETAIGLTCGPLHEPMTASDYVRHGIEVAT